MFEMLTHIWLLSKFPHSLNMQATVWLEAMQIHAIIFCIMITCSLVGGHPVSQEYTAYIFIVNFTLNMEEMCDI